jgi:mevalonate pyrophosphate decarboxylase
VSEAVSEVHRLKKSKQTNEELNSIIQQKNANKKIKCINSDNLNTHRITSTSKPSVATPSLQIALQKSPDALFVKGS